MNVYTSRYRVKNQNFQVVGKSPGEVRWGLGSIHRLLPTLLHPQKYVKIRSKKMENKKQVSPVNDHLTIMYIWHQNGVGGDAKRLQ